jgi:uncharacterized protein HemY
LCHTLLDEPVVERLAAQDVHEAKPHPTRLGYVVNQLRTLRFQYLQTLGGAYALAATSYDLAAARAGPDRLVVIERKLGSLFVRQGTWESAESHFRAALSQGTQIDIAECARLLAVWSVAAHRQDQLERAWTLASEALQTAILADEPRALAECHNIVGMLARHRGDMAAAAHHLECSLQLATDNADLSARVAALNSLALLHARSGSSASGELIGGNGKRLRCTM